MPNRPSRIVVPVYAPSFDGRYHGRYPQGNKPGGADLTAAAHVQAGAAAALSTGVGLSASAAGQVTAAAGLTTGIRLAAGAASQVSASGEISSYSPDYPRLGTYAVGGAQLAPAAELARRHINICPHYPGWEQSKGISLNQLFADAKALSTIGTKCYAYVLYADLIKTASNDGAAYREVYNHCLANNLWAYSNGLTETGQLDSQYSPPNYFKLNYTSNGKLVAGKNLGDWYVEWTIKLHKTGGTFSVGSTNRTVTPNTNIDGLFIDNVFCSERVNADYNRDGSTDGLTVAGSMAYIQQSYKDLVDHLRAQWPGVSILANSADWTEYEFDGLGTFSATVLNQQFDGGVIETVQNYEVANYFKRALNAIAIQRNGYKAMKGGVVEVDIGSLTDYRFMRYWLGICLLSDGYYYPNLGSYLTQELASLWFDEFDFNLGQALEPIQTDPRYHVVGTFGEGVWRRDFENGIVIVGARRTNGGSVATGPNGDQETLYASVSLGGTFYRLYGSQDPTTNNGNAITSISIKPRDAIVLSRTPTKLTAAASSQASVAASLTTQIRPAATAQAQATATASLTTGGGGSNLVHGQNFTISGSGFGTRSVVSDVFNDGSTNANWAGAGSPSGPVTPASVGRGVPVPHSHITQYYAKRVSDGFNGQITLGKVVNVTKPMKVFAMWKQRNDPGWVFGYAEEDNNYKFWGYSNDPDGFTLFDIYHYLDTADFQKSSLTSAHAYKIYSSGGMGALNHNYSPLGGSSEQDLDTWYNWVNLELRYGLDSSGQIFKSLRNNKLLHNLTGLNTDNVANGVRSLGPTVYANSRDPVNNWVYWADIALIVGVDAWKRVMLSTSATWDDENAITEFCPIVSWANTSITATCNQGRIPSGPCHLWTVDANDTPTYQGTRTI